MFTNDMNKLQEKMNRAGAKQIPFLFGVNYELTAGFFFENPLQQTECLFQLKGIGNKLNELVDKKAYLKPVCPSELGYAEKFKTIQCGLYAGNSFLANLTMKTEVESNLSLKEIFLKSNAPYQLYIPHCFVCFSPERFVKINTLGQISTNPMKGTINASVPNAEEVILNDFKESAEHATIVDLLRNDIGMVAKNVEVKRYRYVDRLDALERSILQISSEIVGQLPSNYQQSLGDIIFRMLPAGSISGAPKQSTLKLIADAEQIERGYYSGVFGYFDGKELDSAVLIRYIEKDGDKMYFRSGGGITAYSDCKSEYQEVLEKIYLPFV